MAQKSKKNDDIMVINTASKWFNIVLLVLCFLFLSAVRLQTNHGLTGDEPHYLVEVYSLVHDGDLSLANNYKNQDYKTFDVHPPLEPQGVANAAPQYVEKEYSSHGKGLTYLMAPGFLVAGKTGAVFTLTLLAVAVVYLTWRRTKQVTGNRLIAYLSAGALVICYFFNALVGIIYPDMLIAGIALVTLIMLDDYYKKPKYQILIGLVLGFLVIVHFKALIIVLPALAILAYKLWNSERKIPWYTLLIVGAFVLYYFVSLHQWFGSWNLSSIQQGQPFDSSPFRNIPAMLFDSNRSLFVYNPITFLIVLGLPIWYKLNRRSLIETLIVLGPTVATLSVIPNWNGSASPTGRYLIELLPALMPAVGFALIALKRVWQRIIAGVLAALTFMISINAAKFKTPYINGGLFTTKPALFSQIEANTGLALDKFLPVYSNETTLIGENGPIKVVTWSLLILVIFIYGLYLGKQFKKPAKAN